MKLSGEGWKGEGKGRKRANWLYRRICTLIASRFLAPTEDMVSCMAQWYSDRHDDYLHWTDDDAYRGGRYACGEWTVHLPSVERDFGRACFEALPAEIAVEVFLSPVEMNNLAAAPKEHLADEVATRLTAARLRRRDRFERTCRKCRTRFRPSEDTGWYQAQHRKTCDNCLAAARKHRERRQRRAS